MAWRASGPPARSRARCAQADVIGLHALGITDGRTFAEMDREDPLRPVYLQSVTLRTSLMSA